MVLSITLGTLFAFFGVLAYQSLHLSGPAAAYPGYVLAVLAVVLVAIAVEELRRRGKLQLDAELAEFWPLLPRERAALAGFVGAWIAYVLLLNAIGFILATTLAVAASLLLLGQRGRWKIAAGSLAFALAMTLLVKVVLYVPVPLGAPDLALERLIYSLRGKA